MGTASTSAASTLLQEALRGTASATTPEGASLGILEACIGRLNGTGGSVYMLDMATGNFSAAVSLPTSPKEGQEIPAISVVIPASRVSSVADFLCSVEDYAELKELLPQGVVVYALRGDSCVGAIRVDGPDVERMEQSLLDELVASANLLVSIYEDAFAFELLGALQDPLDFTQSDEEFFRKIARLIARSSGMEFIALRELEDGALRCIALEGFGDSPDLAEWDLEPIERYPAFAHVLETLETQAVSTMDSPEHAELRAHHWCHEVRSFVAIPVLVGLDTFGVLSVGSRYEFDYAPIELRGFESVANGVGVSISNFRASHQLNQQIGEYTAAATAITSIEVARSARHEASNAVEVATQGLHRLMQKVGKAHKEDIYYVDDKLQEIRDALKKIKVATSEPEADWTNISVAELWQQAQTAVVSRLQDAKIEVRNPAADVVVHAREDWIRQVFLNLLLNSIDAFAETGKRADQRVTLTIDKPSERDSDYRITYSDTAGGVVSQRLRTPSAIEELPVKQLIFKGGVTSKKKGSGYGLWLVRKILTDHYGSIDLTDYRKGVTFAITLPTPEEAERLRKERN